MAVATHSQYCSNIVIELEKESFGEFSSRGILASFCYSLPPHERKEEKVHLQMCDTRKKKSTLAVSGPGEKKVRWMVRRGRDEEIEKERNGDRSVSIGNG